MNKLFLLLSISAFGFVSLPSGFAEPIPMILDCDTANEIDDLYAIVRTIKEPKFKILGLTSSHWRTQPNAPDNTVIPSQKMNEDILKLMDKEDIPHPMGANVAMKDPQTPADSPAARFIIKQAHKMLTGEKLLVITTGTMTNLASAILLDPSIVPKIKACSMGLRYENENWSLKEFNSNNDHNAVKCLFTTKGLEWHVMTATASKALVFNREETAEKLHGLFGAYKYIRDHWLAFDPPWKPGSSTLNWVMWDVAAVEAMVDPSLATEIQVPPPEPLDQSRKVWVYTKINAEKMEEQYWDIMLNK